MDDVLAGVARANGNVLFSEVSAALVERNMFPGKEAKAAPDLNLVAIGIMVDAGDAYIVNAIIRFLDAIGDLSFGSPRHAALLESCWALRSFPIVDRAILAATRRGSPDLWDRIEDPVEATDMPSASIALRIGNRSLKCPALQSDEVAVSERYFVVPMEDPPPKIGWH